MPLHQVTLHHDGPALWPQHKPLPEVLELRATTPELTWSGTYQGVPTPPGGYIYKRNWWPAANRYALDDTAIQNQVYARYLSFDTAQKTSDSHDYTGYTVMELWPDYRLALRFAQRQRLEFPYLVDAITSAARTWNADERLHGIIIEDKVSGTSALQTLAASAPAWLRALLIPFMPTTDKVTRASQAAVWCKNHCVLLPVPTPTAVWLADFEDELFGFPQMTHDDLVDPFNQTILYLENILAAGRRARGDTS